MKPFIFKSTTFAITLVAFANIKAIEDSLNIQLFKAVIHNKPKEVSTLLKKGANINATFHGFTPLHLAIHGEHVFLVSLLLNHGAHSNKPTLTGSTPLHMVADQFYGNTMGVVIAEFLLNAGALSNVPSAKNRRTPMELARRNHKWLLIDLFKKYGPKYRSAL